MPGGIHPPVDVVLGWPKPNFTNPEIRSSSVPPLAVFFNIIFVLASGGRIWIRYKVPKTAGLDDVFFVAAIPLIVALTIVIPVATDVHGYNRHVWDNPLSTNVTRRKYALVLMTLFPSASGMLRVSILLFYRRLSERQVSPSFKRLLWITIMSVVGGSICFSLVGTYACRPISAFWNQVDVKKVRAGYTYECFDEAAAVTAASAISSFQDLLTAMLPNLLLWKVQIRLKQKLALIGLFSLAYCAAAMGFLRLYYNYRIYYTTYDVTWSAWTSWLISMLELHLAALCACAPALKTLYTHYGLSQYFQRRRSAQVCEIRSQHWSGLRGPYGNRDSQSFETSSTQKSEQFELSTDDGLALVSPARCKHQGSYNEYRV